MEVLKTVFWILSLAGIFALGYFLVRRLDSFLTENRETIDDEAENLEPSFVILSDDLSEEDIAEQIRRFRKEHDNTCVMLCCKKSNEPPNKGAHHSERKQ